MPIKIGIREILSLEKNKTEIFCHGARQYISTVSIEGEITIADRIWCLVKVLEAIKKSMFVLDNTVETEGQGSFFQESRKPSVKASEKIATNVKSIPGRALQIGPKLGGAAKSENVEATLSAFPDVIIYYHNGKGLYLGRNVET